MLGIWVKHIFTYMVKAKYTGIWKEGWIFKLYYQLKKLVPLCGTLRLVKNILTIKTDLLLPFRSYFSVRTDSTGKTIQKNIDSQYSVLLSDAMKLLLFSYM